MHIITIAPFASVLISYRKARLRARVGVARGVTPLFLPFRHHIMMSLAKCSLFFFFFFCVCKLNNYRLPPTPTPIPALFPNQFVLPVFSVTHTHTHTHTLTRTHARTHTHAHTHARTHTHTHPPAPSLSHSASSGHMANRGMRSKHIIVNKNVDLIGL